MTTEKHELGILLVHGIGTQPAGETITRWGDVLVKAITHATGEKVAATVERAGKGLDGSDGDRIEALVRLEHDGEVEHWLVSEGWWAESFLAPTYGELVSWSLRALPWALTTHIAQRFWLAKSGHTNKAVAVALALIKLVVGLLLAPFAILGLAVVLVVGLLPITSVRVALLKVQSKLSATVGDSLVFVESPVRAALIKTRILAGLEGLQRRCERTIIVAHSQGAAAAVECLGGIVGLDEPPFTQPDTLITFGAGTNPLSTLRRSEGLPKALGFDPVRLATLASLGITVFSSWLALDISSGAFAITKILIAALLWLLLLGFCVTVGYGGIKLAKRLEPTKPRLASRTRGAAVSVSVFAWAAGMFGLYLLGDSERIPAGPVVFLLISMTILGASIQTILSNRWKLILTTVRYPPGLGRWIDIYTMVDPVPCGPTLTSDHRKVESVEVWNEGSVISDHVTYWSNVDEFVLRVLRACAKTAASAWFAKLPADAPMVDARARWRVSWLQIARSALLTISAGLAIVLFPRSYQITCDLAKFIPGWIANRLSWTALERVTLLGLIAAAAWLAYVLVHAVWHWWVRKEQMAVLAQASPIGLETTPLTLMGAVVWAALLVAVAIITGTRPIEPSANATVARRIVEIWGEVLVFAIMSSVAAWISVWLLKQVHPVPTPDALKSRKAPLAA